MKAICEEIKAILVISNNFVSLEFKAINLKSSFVFVTSRTNKQDSVSKSKKMLK